MGNKIDRIKGNNFQKNPQNINRKGRPKKTINVILEDLKKAGNYAVSKSEILEVYRVLVNCTQQELLNYVKDEHASILIRSTAKEILGKDGFKAIETILNRSIGTATQMLGEDADNKFTSFRDVLIKARDNMLKNE